MQRNILSTSTLAKYHLSDNKLQFASVQQYIDGLQKSLWQTLSLFGIVLSIFVILLVLLILILALAYRRLNYESIIVKQFLGYSFKQLYLWPLLMISIINFIVLVVIIIGRSKIGLFISIINLVLQFLIFYFALKKTKFTQNSSKKERT